MPRKRYAPHMRRSRQVIVALTGRELDIIAQLKDRRGYGSMAKTVRQCALEAAERAGITSQVR